MEKVLSGIRPTGHLHLGNYFGAVKSFVKMQNEYDCYFFIADWHSLTTCPSPENIRQSVRTILAEYLACGLEPDKATLYVQSDVRETLEIYLYFNMNTYLGELERVTTFKEKARKQPDNVNAGLLTYPTLMAADILQHRAHWVPVGKDQEQNMEMARKCARRFNNIYKVEFFPDRAPSYKCNPWEFQSGNSEKNYTFYIPITADLIGKDLEAWTLTFNDKQVKPEVWITAYPIPFRQKALYLQRK